MTTHPHGPCTQPAYPDVHTAVISAARHGLASYIAVKCPRCDQWHLTTKPNGDA